MTRGPGSKGSLSRHGWKVQSPCCYKKTHTHMHGGRGEESEDKVKEKTKGPDGESGVDRERLELLLPQFSVFVLK